MSGTIQWQRAEGAGIFAVAIAIWLLSAEGPVWWAALLIFFAPDLAFAGYLAGPRVGAVFYNLVHLYAFGAGVALAGLLAGQPALVGPGLLWVAHAGFDRMLGYGLKSAEGFGVTHLGRIGRDT